VIIELNKTRRIKGSFFCIT